MGWGGALLRVAALVLNADEEILGPTPGTHFQVINLAPQQRGADPDFPDWETTDLKGQAWDYLLPNLLPLPFHLKSREEHFSRIFHSPSHTLTQ